MSPIGTASELPRLARCPASKSLPQHPVPATESTDLGTIVHRALRTGEVPEDDEARATFEQALAVLPPGAWRHEVALALEPTEETARELGVDLERDYSGALSTELVGTADAREVSGNPVRILEIKTGWRPVGADGWQTRFLALAAARAYGCDSVEVLLLTAHPDGAYIATHSYDVFGLDELAEQVRGLVASLKAPSEPQPGDWCRYCPAMASCPAATGIVRALAIAPEPTDATSEITPARAAAAYRLAKAARAALTRLEAQLEAYALQQPIQLGEGRVWGFKPSEQQVFGPKAVAWLRSQGLDKAINESASATSLGKAVGKAKATWLLNEMRTAGVVTVKPGGRMAEYSERDE